MLRSKKEGRSSRDIGFPSVVYELRRREGHEVLFTRPDYIILRLIAVWALCPKPLEMSIFQPRVLRAKET